MLDVEEVEQRAREQGIDVALATADTLASYLLALPPVEYTVSVCRRLVVIMGFR